MSLVYQSDDAVIQPDSAGMNHGLYRSDGVLHGDRRHEM